jgi:hypothetical protein
MLERAIWEEEYQAEVAQARVARQSGNEGMARVCARRAVGILLGEYLAQQGVNNPGTSAYDRMRLFQSLPHLAAPIREVIDHFLVHVTPDRTLPGNHDLIAEAEWLASQIFVEEN